MKYWLMKSEITTFNIDDLAALPNQTDGWDGVRNYQARNMMRDEMKIGDQVFFYHSNCSPPAIAGVMEVVKESHPDHTAFDPEDSHYDPKSDPDNPRWFMVDVKFKKKFKQPISLPELRQCRGLEKMLILRKGNRLSITPVTKEEWDIICRGLCRGSDFTVLQNTLY